MDSKDLYRRYVLNEHGLPDNERKFMMFENRITNLEIEISTINSGLTLLMKEYKMDTKFYLTSLEKLDQIRKRMEHLEKRLKRKNFETIIVILVFILWFLLDKLLFNF